MRTRTGIRARILAAAAMGLLAALLAGGGPAARAAQITGTIYHKGSLTGSVAVGYVGVTAGGETIFNMAGLTPAGSSAVVWCDTWKPRRTGLTWKASSGLRFQHLKLPAGRYLIYVRYDESYLDWKTVTVPDANARIQTTLAISPAQTGELRFRVSRGGNLYSIRLTPLGPDGKSLLPEANPVFGPTIEVETRGEMAVVRGVRAGSYQVTLRRAHRQGAPDTGTFTTYTDLGTWRMTAQKGKSLEFRLS